MKNNNNNVGLDEKSVLLVVTFSRLGIRRKVSTAEIEVDADKSMLRVNKRLFDCAEYDAIRTHDGKTMHVLKTRALPSFFKEGVYRVPNELVSEVEAYLTERAAGRAKLVQDFAKVYPQRVKEAFDALRSLGDKSEYLSTEAAIAEFSLTWRYLSFSTPSVLKAINKDLFQHEREKFAASLKQAEDEIKAVLRASMSQLVKRMVTQLTPSADGKKKKIYDSLTGNMEDFLNTFNVRNLANDHDLNKLVTQARGILKGVNSDVLREADGVRASVLSDFAKMEKTLDKMVVEKPSRHFDFSE